MFISGEACGTQQPTITFTNFVVNDQVGQIAAFRERQRPGEPTRRIDPDNL